MIIKETKCHQSRYDCMMSGMLKYYWRTASHNVNLITEIELLYFCMNGSWLLTIKTWNLLSSHVHKKMFSIYSWYFIFWCQHWCYYSLEDCEFLHPQFSNRLVMNFVHAFFSLACRFRTVRFYLKPQWGCIWKSDFIHIKLSDVVICLCHNI